MKIRVFNPEHDLALAANLANFTAPHAGRQLRADLGYLPALWAEADDVVLVEHPDEAECRFRRLTKRPFGRFVTREQLAALPAEGVDVWGWDLAIRAFLLRCGVAECLLPGVEAIAAIRDLSHRRHAGEMLAQLQGPGVVGEAVMLTELQPLYERFDRGECLVVKAPWSSSGRGVRFYENTLTNSDFGWLHRILATQGAIMIEPHYNKVRDFGMEFSSDGEGHVTYLGLSLFSTAGTAYTGNVLASEEEKMETISRYIPDDLLVAVRQKIESLSAALFRGRYAGPFGIDMMVVARPDRDGFLLHPCIEINLRRTMGHVAISLTRHLQRLPRVMTIISDNFTYKIQLSL